MITNKKNYSLIIKNIEKQYTKTNIPQIDIGDNIKIKLLIQEGNKERIKTSEGVVIAKHNAKLNTTITIRKIIQNIGVERIYLIHSPRILNIEVVRQSKIRKAKLYYLRQRSGKATRLKQRLQ
uniref:Large ribosomal subunit protein bL19c n=1 Tax=Thuretia quercifolia TaxID=189650 RepID=A0A1Z1ML80_9FLOR|nr:ribosomal protein L19 [Thuretia quercifolia]ARW66501.1 ribosomal protein L19 [Thuretia quercifolia]